MALHHCRVVLVETHYPGNLGAVARVMCNFGLGDLVLVKPVASPHDRNARQMSTQGETILDRARVVGDFAEAVHDCVLVVGTSARSGGLFRRQSVGTPDEIMPHVVECLAKDQPAALVFGSEPNGLPDELVTRCHHLISIPTAEAYPSLNLAQAVAICLYELHGAWLGTGGHAREVGPAQEPADFQLQEQVFRQLQTALEEIHFLYGDKAGSLLHGLRHLLGKARMSTMEARLLLGLARQIRWYVAQRGPSAGEMSQ